MSKPWDIIKVLESDNSRLFKEDHLSRYIVKDQTLYNPMLVKGLVYGLDSMITFGIADIPEASYDSNNSKGLLDTDFYVLADKLKNRELTGHAARDAIIVAMQIATAEQWNGWYRRILLKDFRAGFGINTVNKVAKGTVPVFQCMLAHSGDNNPKKITGEVVVEYKYDGVRAVVIVQNDTAVIYSRNGKLLTNFPHIEKAFSKKIFNDLVFDGEVMSADFQSLMKQIHRKEGAQTEDAYFALFDFLPIAEFREGKSTLPITLRKAQLNILSKQFDDSIRLVDYQLMDLNEPDGVVKFEAMNKEAIEKGYEGIMVKPQDGLYECKRSYGWLKMKPYIELTLTVVDMEEGTGKNVGLLGALVCEGSDEGKDFSVNVGTGLSDADRKLFWEQKDAVIGQLVEIRADSISLSQTSEDLYSLRFPRFKTFRGFEPGEKL
jgi:DNA ligase 1